MVAAVVSFALAAYSLTLPHTPPKKDAAGADPLAWREAIKLLGIPSIAVLFLVTFIDSTVHQGYFMMVDDFFTKRVGIDANLSMIVQSLGQVMEIVTMFILGGVLAKLGWKATMMVGILGHAARFSVFAFFPDSLPTIIAVQLLHGVCYAFFFATVYIFVDNVFPKDVRASAQGLFNLLILGFGNVAASFLFPPLMAHWTDPATKDVDYHTQIQIPAGMPVVAILLKAQYIRHTTPAPARVAAAA